MDHVLLTEILRLYPNRRIQELRASEINAWERRSLREVNSRLVAAQRDLAEVESRIELLKREIEDATGAISSLRADFSAISEETKHYFEELKICLNGIYSGKSAASRDDMYTIVAKSHLEELTKNIASELSFEGVLLKESCKSSQTGFTDVVELAIENYAAASTARGRSADYSAAKSALGETVFEEQLQKENQNQLLLEKECNEVETEAQMIERLETEEQMAEQEIRIKAKQIEMLEADFEGEGHLIEEIRKQVNSTYEQSDLISRINSCSLLHEELSKNQLIEVQIERRLRQLLGEKL